jgi:hypothetical protein
LLLKGGFKWSLTVNEKTQINTHMKTSMITKSFLAFLLILGATAILPAQSAKPVCPLGNQPGYGRTLTPEQRAQHRTAVQQMVTELRQKQANGTLTAEEKTWLQQVEQRGGMCINGTPRGPGAGQGPGAGNCAGACRGQGKGLRDGTGPRSANGTCPNMGSAAQAGPKQSQGTAE